MPTKTKIEWADFSSNPIRARRKDNGKGYWACVKVSPGCVHCYAETINKRFGTGLDYAAQSMKLVEPYLDEREMERLLKSKKLAGKRVFIGDMTDIFGEWVEDAWLDKLFALFALRPDVTWIVLTKRAKRMEEWSTPGFDNREHEIGGAILRMTKGAHSGLIEWPLPNVWLGVSIEDDNHRDRAEHLVQTPAAVRFVSAEPLLAPIDFRPWLRMPDGKKGRLRWNKNKVVGRGDAELDAGEPGLDWIIVGGESGPGARPCDIGWIKDIVEQCREAHVPVFVKQDSGPKPGQQGRIPNALWIKEWPDAYKRAES